MDPTELSHHAATLGQDAHGLADQSRNLADHLDSLAQQIAVQAQYAGHGGSNFTFFLTEKVVDALPPVTRISYDAPQDTGPVQPPRPN